LIRGIFVRDSHATRIKICGITRVEDALAAVAAGADAIGMVFYAKSPRAVSVEQAAAIAAALPPFVTTVGLFVNPGAGQVDAVLGEVPLDLLQFHGDESAEFCALFERPYLKALRVRPGLDIAAFAHAHHAARGLLLDAWDPDQFGGTGRTFDWKLIGPEQRSSRIILAGGLTPANVAEAIQTVRPWAVDVSSGVEDAPGIKSHSLMQSFISEVKRV
jgi:phosphoribosylanthranilate isomerase